MSIPLPPFSEPCTVLTNGTMCYTAEQLRAIQREAVRVALEAAARPEPDCRTCEHFYVIPRGKLCRECANGDNHQQLPPVRLYRKGLD